MLRGPASFDTDLMEEVPKRREEFGVFPNRLWLYGIRYRCRSQMASDLTDVPLYWVESIAAVSDVCCADVFRARNEVVDSLGDQSAQRQLKRQCREVNVVVPARARMQIDLVMTNPY